MLRLDMRTWPSQAILRTGQILVIRRWIPLGAQNN
jgi:hypothetical protein